MKRFEFLKIWRGVSLCFVLCYLSPALALTPAQDELLKSVQNNVLALLESIRTDSAQLASCFASSICPGRMADRLPQFEDVIRGEVKRYRLLVGLYRIDFLKKGHRRVAPFLTAVPPLLLSNQEADQVFRIAADDGSLAGSDLKPSQTSGLKKDATEFYRLQLEHLLNRFPFLAYLESERPSSIEISRALQKVYMASSERQQSVAELNGEELRRLLIYRPILDAVIAKRPELQTAYEELMSRPAPGIFGLSKDAESMIYQSYLGCVGLFLLAPGWPMGMTCTAIALVSSTGKLIDNFETYQVSRADWLAGLQTFQSFRHDRNQLVLSAVTLAVMGYTWYPVVGMIKGPLSAALEQTLVQTARRVVSARALKDTAVGFGQSFARTKLRIGGAYFILKDHSERSDQDVLVPVELESGLDALLIETGPFFRFADFRRLGQQMIQIWR